MVLKSLSSTTDCDIHPSIANEHPDLRTYSGSDTDTDFLRTSIKSDTDRDFLRISITSGTDFCTAVVIEANLRTSIAVENVDHNPDLCTFIAKDTDIRTSVAADRKLRTSAADDNVNPGVYLTFFLPQSSRCESWGVVQNCINNPQQQQEKEESTWKTTEEREVAANFCKSKDIVESNANDIPNLCTSVVLDPNTCTSIANFPALRTFIADDSANLFTEVIA